MTLDKSRILVTTALEQSWPENQPILFLGEWCRLHAHKDRWAGMDAEVMPYHWDDREKLLLDFQYLQALNEQLLRELSGELNRIHGENRSLRYWCIVLGQWLNFFTGTVFDRWEMVRRAAATGSITGSRCLTIPDEQLVANDTTNFGELIVGDHWNHALYARLMKGWTDIPLDITSYEPGPDCLVEKALPIGAPRRIKRYLANQATRLSSMFVRPNECFFISSYLPLLEDLKLQWRLGQLPKIWQPPSVPRVKLDMRQRKWKLNPTEQASTFEEIVRALIPEQLPTIFLEGYRKISQVVNQLPWPRRPRLIWTSNHHLSDDVFRMWAASRVDLGCSFVTGQHGGEATGLFNGSFSFQEKICDSHLTWARDTAANTKEKPVGMLQMPAQQHHRESKSIALLVTVAIPRYSFDMRSMSIGGQMLPYFEDQFTFVENLSAPIRDALTVRLYPQDYGWGQAARWRDRFPDLRLDKGQANINDLIRQSRLYISTYNATTYLESFTMNVPTIIYWNPNHWELRDSAIPYFEDLKRVGIFHETPESAARHVTAIWDDVDAWWTSPSVREVLERFKARYCHLPDDLLDRVEAALREVMADGKSQRPKLVATDTTQLKV